MNASFYAISGKASLERPKKTLVDLTTVLLAVFIRK